MEKRVYRVEYLSRPYAGGIPWDDAGIAYRGTSERRALREYNRLYRWYHPQQNAWSGHVRITDGTYLLEPVPGLPKIDLLEER